MPFYLSYSNSAGLRLPSSDTMLTPAPSYTSYPEESLGSILETADSTPVIQVGNKDGRAREWVWVGYKDTVPGYTTLWDNLLTLRSRHRKEAGAQTPYVYLRDTETSKLRRRVTYTGNATATFNTTTLQNSAAPFPGSNALAGYKVIFIDGQGAGQTAYVATNTTTVLTLASTLALAPNATTRYLVVGYSNDWLKVRVIDVSRVQTQIPTLPPTFERTTLKFVIDDSAYNDG